jgi:hypothetical protein
VVVGQREDVVCMQLCVRLCVRHGLLMVAILSDGGRTKDEVSEVRWAGCEMGSCRPPGSLCADRMRKDGGSRSTPS